MFRDVEQIRRRHLERINASKGSRIKIISVMKTKDKFQIALGALIVIGFFSLLILLSVVKVPPENKDLLNIVVGGLIAAFATIVGYYFGSSSSSAKKDETIGNIATNTQNITS